MNSSRLLTCKYLILSMKQTSIVFLVLLWTVVCGLSTAAPSTSSGQASPQSDATASASPVRANVLFIAVDDLNDWIGCLSDPELVEGGGHPQALTPNMDRLAARGVLFTNAHCAAPACNPSRAAVFSGLMPDKTGVWSNQSGSIDKLKPDAVQLPVSFKKAGYRTLGTGKLLHSKGTAAFDDYLAVEQRWSPLSKSAVDYTDEELPTKGTEDPRHVVTHNGKSYTLPLNRMPSDRRPNEKGGESFDWGPFDVPDADFGDTQITDWAIERLQQHANPRAEGASASAWPASAPASAPFFLGVGYYRPHIPLWAPKRFFDRFKDNPGKLPPVRKDDLDDLSDIARKWALEPVTAGSHATTVKHDQWRAAVEAYLACVTYVDHEIGRLLDALDASGHADNTAVVLWSDHGWHLGEKEHWGKWTGWERSTRVPLIIVPPRNRAAEFAAAGSRCDQPVGLIDLFPTLTDLCNVDSPKGLDGKSLVPLLRDPATATGRKLVTMFDPGNVSVRSERWRYIRYADGSEELYDIKADPNEWENLAGNPKHAEIVARLAQSLATSFRSKTSGKKPRS